MGTESSTEPAPLVPLIMCRGDRLPCDGECALAGIEEHKRNARGSNTQESQRQGKHARQQAQHPGGLRYQHS